MKAPRIRCGWEGVSDLLREPGTRELLIEYWTELSPVKDVARLDPDFEQMTALEEAGRFRVWACRVDGALAGFVSFHVVTHQNYRGTLFAIDGGHYLNPAFRGNGRVGYRMWRSATAALKELGVRIVLAHDNAARPLIPFFLGLGFEPRSVVYWKVLDDADG